MAGPGVADEEREHERIETEDLPAAVKHPLPLTSIATVGLFILALFYTLRLGRAFFMPVVVAILLDFLLKPAVRGLQRLRIPMALGAALVLGGLLSAAIYGVVALSTPAATWLERAPKSLPQVERKIRELRKPVEQMSETAERIAQMATSDADTEASVARTYDARSRLLAGARAAVVESVAVIILLYFLMASGDMFLRKLVRVLPTFSDKKRAVEIARETEHHISRYLATITLINAGLGVAVGIAVHLAGLPNAVLWGVMVGVLNFVPYLGATVGIGILAIVSLLTFESPWSALIPPASYLVLATLEGNFVTPYLLGRRFTLNPVAVFVWLAFWGFLWGVPGMLVAVPLLAILKIACDHVEPLLPLGEFLGE
jgi:predicted PurR-regulated permease PerM